MGTKAVLWLMTLLFTLPGEAFHAYAQIIGTEISVTINGIIALSNGIILKGIHITAPRSEPKIMMPNKYLNLEKALNTVE